MRILKLSELNPDEKKRIITRPAVNQAAAVSTVEPMLKNIKNAGLKAVLDYASEFDGFSGNSLRVTEEEFAEAEEKIDLKLKNAIRLAFENIHKFHKEQFPKRIELTTMPGVVCSREYRAIENVGLYVPGGNAVLPSTMLMLGIPAKIAGCKRVVVCSPSKDNKINYPLLFAAKLCGIKEFYKIGGAQAIGLMAYGCEGILKTDKIFGPGNRYVTTAKMLVSIDPAGCAIDMPAGPSEVMIIADNYASTAFAAADMLSQLEHGTDSTAVLLAPSEEFAAETLKQIEIQRETLIRNDAISKSLEESVVLVYEKIEDALVFSNEYAPEHLILSVSDSDKYKEKIHNAGSVFLGNYSPESVGDYASGTNHSLPTYGFARAYSGLGTDAFMKSTTFQRLSREGLQNISECVIRLAEAEGLDAHANAVKVRLKDEYK